MTQVVSTIEPILRYIQPQIVNETAEQAFLYDTVKRDGDNFTATGGRRILVPLMTNYNRNFGGRSDNSQFPAPGQRTLEELSYSWPYFYMGLSVSDPAIAHGAGVGAVEDELQMELDALPVGFRGEVSRMMYGIGNGVITTVKTAGGPVTVIPVASVQYLMAGDNIDIVDATTGIPIANGQNMQIVAVDYVNVTITVATAVTVVVGNAIVRTGNFGLETEGLQSLANPTHPVGGVDPTVAGNEWWVPPYAANPAGGAGTPAQETDLMTMIDNVHEAEVILSTKGTRRRTALQFSQMRRYNDAEATKIRGGYSAIYIDEVPFIRDRYAPKGKIFAYRRRALTLFELKPPGWLDADGLILRMSNQGLNTWVAYWSHYFAFGTQFRREVGLLDNCQDDLTTSAYEA